MYLGGGVLLLLVFLYWYFSSINEGYTSIVSFDDCVKAGYPVLKRYPEQCKMPGKVFVNPDQKEALVAEKKPEPSFPDYKNITYIFEGEEVPFVRGIGILPKNELLRDGTTTIEASENPFKIDITGDSISDIVFILHTKSAKNTYYLASAIGLHQGYVGTNALLLGDDVSVPVFSYLNGLVELTYTASSSKQIKRTFGYFNSLLQEK